MLGQENNAKTYVGFRRIAKPIKQCPKSVGRKCCAHYSQSHYSCQQNRENRTKQ